MQSVRRLSKAFCPALAHRFQNASHTQLHAPAFTLSPWPSASSPPPPARASCATSALPLKPIRSPSNPCPASPAFPLPKKTAPPSPPTPRSRPSTTRASLPANWSWPTTPASKWTRSTARPACAPPALPPTPASSTRPTPTTTPTSGTTWSCCSGSPAFPPPQRTARYRCVLVAARDGEVLHIAEGTVEGLILEAPRGTGGFGYDPLFYLPALDRTMAELDLETKLSLSHRGRAIAALLPMLNA